MSDAAPAIAKARCMWMRGGTSKGGYFLKDDLPADTAERDAFLLRVMGSPDPRQIDGMGGADPLTSKVAVVSKSDRPGVDVDYLFLQVFVDQAIVTDAQNCGNILAGVGPFTIERGRAEPSGDVPRVAIFMENPGQVAVASVATPGGTVRYDGDAVISGVPGTAAPIPLAFRDTAGSSCGALLPTRKRVDEIDGVAVTMIDNGMPCVVIAAEDMGITGYEDRDTLDADTEMKAKVEAIRLKAGPLMNLGEVSAAAKVAAVPDGLTKTLGVEHPTGVTECIVTVDENGQPVEAGMLRTARKLMDGEVFSRAPPTPLAGPLA